MTAASTAYTARVRSVDIVRGAVMVLMAIDHVRVFAGVPAGGPTAALFLTRWVTNFCAPAFVFFAGVSIFLYAEKRLDRTAVSRWLLLRGAWLVLLELTFLRLAWTFNIDFSHYMLAGVIWMLGWCMILMAGLIHFSVRANALIGVLIMAGHDLTAQALSGMTSKLLHGPLGWLGRIVYFGGAFSVGGAEEPNFFVLYSLIPWIGVMAGGYAFGAVFRMEPERRNKICRLVGGGAIAAFVVLQCVGLLVQQGGSEFEVPLWIKFLSARKYPASFVFLCMTIGPAVLVLPWLEAVRGRISGWLTVFGRVPLFYYLLHIPLIHLLAFGISMVRTPLMTDWLIGNHPVMPPPVPPGYMWSLPLLYLVTALVVFMLYFACRWFAELKTRRKDAWLSYL